MSKNKFPLATDLLESAIRGAKCSRKLWKKWLRCKDPKNLPLTIYPQKRRGISQVKAFKKKCEKRIKEAQDKIDGAQQELKILKKLG